MNSMDFLSSARALLNTIQYFERRINRLETEDLLRELFGKERMQQAEISASRSCVEELWKCCYALPAYFTPKPILN